ncbi:acyltransferase family protein [Ramlibacter sp.]|uniref:acyltransferase family protein n=1 Tax=Ramlibacter sp. TaxID=1917967 RepID=UPI003D115603
MNASPARVLGWDLLRGLCALTVALYHLMYWLQIAELPALGTYGVYLFFVLSGASLAYNYGQERVATLGDMGRFLAVRWLRLAPLYIALCLAYSLVMAVMQGRTGFAHLAGPLLLNASFAFGFYNPSQTALLIGGWSLGIEFVFYLLYPLIASVLPYRTLALALFAVVVGVQWWWIERTIGTHGWLPAVTAYHQLPAFGAYFFGGCLIGWLRRTQTREWTLPRGVLAWCGMAFLLLALMPEKPGDELLGARGATLFVACFAVVYASGRVAVKGRLVKFAQWFGDMTYGLYLLHPILLFSILWFVLPQAPQMPLSLRWALLAAIVAVSSTAATLSERYFEKPIRRRFALPLPR